MYRVSVEEQPLFALQLAATMPASNGIDFQREFERDWALPIQHRTS